MKTKVIFRYIQKASQTKFHQIRITKSKVIHVQIWLSKWEKTKKWEKNFWVTKRGSKGITNRVYKLGLQVLVITYWYSFRDFKSVQRDFKSGQDGFQIGARITNRCRATPLQCRMHIFNVFLFCNRLTDFQWSYKNWKGFFKHWIIYAASFCITYSGAASAI